MRILTISHFYEAHGGGIERVAGHLSRQFTQLGNDASWAASDRDPLPEDATRTIPLPCFNPLEKLTGLPMPIPGLRAVKSLMQAVRAHDALVIHDSLYVTSILAMMMARMHKKRTVLIQHIATIPFSSRPLRAIMKLANATVTRAMLRAADIRIFISDTVRRDLLGTPPRLTCQVLFNGVDRSTFYPAPPGSTKRAEPGAPLKILFVGRYVEKKGLSILKEVAASRPDLTFLLAGNGPIRPGEWGLANVRDLGQQSSNALAELYRDADLLLLPSVGEGYPLVIQEAMACGLPVICGSPTHQADPGAAAWLRGVEIDLTAPQASAGRIVGKIDTAILSPVQRLEMARYAHAQYDWHTMAGRILALIQKGDGSISVSSAPGAGS